MHVQFANCLFHVEKRFKKMLKKATGARCSKGSDSAMVQNALVQGFTWYRLEIITASRIYCLNVESSAGGKHTRFNVFQRIFLKNYLQSVCFMCHNLTFYSIVLSSLRFHFVVLYLLELSFAIYPRC